MIEGKPSVTAQGVAVRRAAHRLLDSPLILDDPHGFAIVGKKAEAEFAANRARHTGTLGRLLRAFLVARSRLAEDLLAEAYGKGVRQYVLLGAGLDTFAYRNPHAGLRVFEVDFPATQEWKRGRLAEAGITVPDSVVYAPCDFTTESAYDRLIASGLDLSAPAFISWLGVTMYLEPGVVLDTIRMLRPMIAAPGGLVFDYFGQPESFSLLRRMLLFLFSRRLARAGEPLRSTFVSAQLRTAILAAGCTHAEDFDSAALAARYFAGRADRLTVKGRGHLMHVQG